MAMRLDLQDHLKRTSTQINGRKQKMKTLQGRGIIPDNPPLTFKEPLMYGGQGELTSCPQCQISPPTLQISHAGRPHSPANIAMEPIVTHVAPPAEVVVEQPRLGASGTAVTGGKGSNVTPTTPPLEAGLEQPRLQATGEAITGKNKSKMRAENRKRRRALQQEQGTPQFWTEHTGRGVLPATAEDKSRPIHRNFMCPAGLALTHPAADTLLDWATFGCPTKTGQPWSRTEIDEAIARGPHRSALTPDAIAHFAEEAREKVRTNQARIIEWDAIRDNPPKELKISPIRVGAGGESAGGVVVDGLERTME